MDAYIVSIPPIHTETVLAMLAGLGCLVTEVKRDEADKALEGLHRAACTIFGQKSADVRSASRRAELFQVRSAVMYAARTRFGLSFKQIGAFYRRDHSTVMNAVDTLKRDMRQAPALRERVDHLLRVVDPPPSLFETNGQRG